MVGSKKESLNKKDCWKENFFNQQYIYTVYSTTIHLRQRYSLIPKLNLGNSMNYTGEVGVILINLSSEEQTIEPGERVAQLVFSKVDFMELIEISEIIKETERGSQGYGDSGRF